MSKIFVKLPIDGPLSKLKIQLIMNNTYAAVKTSGRNNEPVQNGLDFGHQIGNGRLLGLRRCKILITFQKSLEQKIFRKFNCENFEVWQPESESVQ